MAILSLWETGIYMQRPLHAHSTWARTQASIELSVLKETVTQGWTAYDC